jgi:MATE family multidrug resistance protein
MKGMEKQQERIKKLLITGWPIIAGQVGLVLMGVADTVMVGKIGHIPLAAAGLAVSIFFLISIFGIGLISITSALVTAERAKGNELQLSGLLRDSVIIGQLIGLVLFILMVIVIRFLPQLGQEPEVAAQAGPFLFLLALSVFPMYIYMSGKSLCDGYYYTLFPMIVTIGALLLNIFLNWILIYGNWGCPPLGLLGAGWATLISRIVMAVAIFIFIFKSPGIKFKFRDVVRSSFKGKFYRSILKLGVPSGFQYFFEVAAFSGAAIIAGKIGAIPQAAHQIAINIASLTFMFAVGIASSGSMYVAEHYARNDLAGARRYGISALWLVVGVEIVFASIFISMHKILPGFYNNETEVIEIASLLILIAAVFQIVDGLQAVSLGLLRGLHDTKMPSILTFVAYWIIGIPSSIYLGIYTSSGIYGVWWALTLSLFFISITTTWRFRAKTSMHKH